jgi:hypothetical protein
MGNSFVVRRLAPLATTAALALGMLAVGTAAQTRPALAACSGFSCDFQDPQTSGCHSDAVTLDQVDTAGGFEVQFRWSRSCAAGWARSAGPYTTRIQVAIDRYVCHQRIEGVCVYSVDSEEIISMFSGGWTDMLGDEGSGLRARDVSHSQITHLWLHGSLVSQ